MGTNPLVDKRACFGRSLARKSLIVLDSDGRGGGFEPPTPWSRTNNRCAKLLFRLGLFCVLYRLSVWFSGTIGPKLDPNKWVSGQMPIRAEEPTAFRTFTKATDKPVPQGGFSNQACFRKAVIRPLPKAQIDLNSSVRALA
jgi:hypothetical protein